MRAKYGGADKHKWADEAGCVFSTTAIVAREGAAGAHQRHNKLSAVRA